MIAIKHYLSKTAFTIMIAIKHYLSKTAFTIMIALKHYLSKTAFTIETQDRRGRDRMVVALTTTYAISAYHH
jgi:NO-binding membrane sensor protein with MHYT domain